jgi:hypothetical protein
VRAPVWTLCVPVLCSNGDRLSLRLTRRDAEALYRELRYGLGMGVRPAEPEEEGGDEDGD